MPAYTFAHLNLGLPSVFLALFEAWVGVWATPSLVLYSDPWQILSYQSGSLRRALAQCYKGDLTALIGAVIETGNGVPDAFVSINGLTPAVERAALQAFSQAYAEAYRMVLYSTIPFGIIAVVAALFTKDSTNAGQEPGERAEHSPVNPDEKTP
ncbi:hypothetical protein LTS15_005666 [Exophiala xenobiotica]|nr:hypothetical protein LTS15_005666 [Exophiala xenobiotica]